MGVRVIHGDALEVLRTLPAGSGQCCVTSPPYWGLRDYGVSGQLGLEDTPEDYVEKLVAILREARRVLRDDGTLWLNLGDSYTSGGRAGHGASVGEKQATNRGANVETAPARAPLPIGLKPKDLVGIPWMVAFALRADGWYLRSDIIWHKANPMPESVTDRPTKSHEYVFLLSKSERYFYDAEAVEEPSSDNPVSAARRNRKDFGTVGTTAIRGTVFGQSGKGANADHKGDTRNARSVWTIATRPFSGAHFATMPPRLAELCVLAGSRVGDTILDPFGGAGTTGLVADRLGRDAVLIELNPEYAGIARDRIGGDAPLFTEVSV